MKQVPIHRVIISSHDRQNASSGGELFFLPAHRFLHTTWHGGEIQAQRGGSAE